MRSTAYQQGLLFACRGRSSLLTTVVCQKHLRLNVQWSLTNVAVDGSLKKSVSWNDRIKSKERVGEEEPKEGTDSRHVSPQDEGREHVQVYCTREKEGG